MGTGTTRNTQTRLQLAVFVALAIFMILGPFYRQVLGGESWLFRPWVMFSTRGIENVVATFYVVDKDGAWQELDRFDALGYSPASSAPRDVRLLRGLSGLEVLEQRLCSTLSGDTDLRVTARIARRSGWQDLERNAGGNVCNRIIGTAP